MTEAKQPKTGVGLFIPKDQSMIWKVTPNAGAIMTAQCVGGQLVALGDMLRAIAQEDSGQKWRTGITRIATLDDGSIEFELVIGPETRNEMDPPKEPEFDLSPAQS